MKEKPSIAQAFNLPTAEQLSAITGNPVLDCTEPEEDYDEFTELSDKDDSTELSLESIKNSMIELKQMRTQLKDIPDITSRKSMLDRLAQKAEDKFEEIFDRAFTCEDRFASEMINSATTMLKIALDAHAKVIDSDIKLIDMQIKKDKIEIELNQSKKGNGNIQLGADQSIEGTKVTVLNRNERLAQRKTNK